MDEIVHRSIRYEAFGKFGTAGIDNRVAGGTGGVPRGRRPVRLEFGPNAARTKCVTARHDQNGIAHKITTNSAPQLLFQVVQATSNDA